MLQLQLWGFLMCFFVKVLAEKKTSHSNSFLHFLSTTTAICCTIISKYFKASFLSGVSITLGYYTQTHTKAYFYSLYNIMFCVPEHARLMCIKMCRQPATSGHRVVRALLETAAAAEAKTKMVFKCFGRCLSVFLSVIFWTDFSSTIAFNQRKIQSRTFTGV